ncbi:MAG TPA: symmetrical bis(5'-nucleosyl)-tetraphosphatase [Gammaproteobacteria bacterium]|nr:symmetrical bis(5'-nucleosyl)-tetraphosphatase [Gammaproteobacteria bacterium]HIL95772.1 symmetrical bis(5'-nucleosyl)-tetraphosphatase [Pseudomonadales bacterium]
MSTYALGDIQGCFDELQLLLRSINFDEHHDELWFVGDLINRGPKNLETIDFVMSLPRVKVVLGNHDLHFLAVATGHHAVTRSDTLDDLLQAPHLKKIIDWMRHLPLIVRNETLGCTMVHAGIPPIWTVDEAIEFGSEVSQVLGSDRYNDFFTHMYGNQPSTWSDQLEGWDRLRVITNYLTRLRYCTNDGEMELTHKAEIQPDGFSPWFTFPLVDNQPDQEGQLQQPLQQRRDTILFGHWAAIEGITHQPGIIALDTGCVWGRELTAYRLEDQQFFSVSAINR